MGTLFLLIPGMVSLVTSVMNFQYIHTYVCHRPSCFLCSLIFLVTGACYEPSHFIWFIVYVVVGVGRGKKIKITEGPEKEGVCHGFQNWWVFVDYFTLVCE